MSSCLNKLNGVRYNRAAMERLRFIDAMLAYFGVVQRVHLADYFGISIQQASHDIADYLKLMPENMQYDKSARTYRKSERFRRLIP